MTFNWKIVGLAAVIVIAAVIIYSQVGTQTAPGPQGQVESRTEAAKTQPPAPTGKVDGTISALLLDATNEQSKLSEEEGDSALLKMDSQAVSDFGQSVNENDY